MKLWTAIVISFLCPAWCLAIQPAPVEVEFVVTVPADSSGDATAYISGSTAALGNWRADGLPLLRSDDGRYRARVSLPDAAEVEFKLTLGDWRRVECDAAGRDIPNRRFRAASGATVNIVVEAWAGSATTTRSAPEESAKPTSGPSRSAGAQAARRSTITGDVRLHERFRSRALNNERTIAVYLPPDYKRRPTARYPVLYMHDGQNLFDAATSFLGIEWQADEHAERLIAAGRISPIIIVGIYNTPDRMDEYTPQADAERGVGGRGRPYARFVVTEVKPFIDETYRTLPDRANTSIAGSSLGGLVSLYMARERRDVFAQCGVVSPALMWADAALLKETEAAPDWMLGTRFWLDMGTDEGRQIGTFNRAIELTRRLERSFLAAGLITGRDYYYAEVHQGQHNEAAWAERFDRMLLFFYGQRAPEADNSTPTSQRAAKSDSPP